MHGLLADDDYKQIWQSVADNAVEADGWTDRQVKYYNLLLESKVYPDEKIDIGEAGDSVSDSLMGMAEEGAAARRARDAEALAAQTATTSAGAAEAERKEKRRKAREEEQRRMLQGLRGDKAPAVPGAAEEAEAQERARVEKDKAAKAAMKKAKEDADRILRERDAKNAQRCEYGVRADMLERQGSSHSHNLTPCNLPMAQSQKLSSCSCSRGTQASRLTFRTDRTRRLPCSRCTESTTSSKVHTCRWLWEC